jgi:hypothetical protein
MEFSAPNIYGGEIKQFLNYHTMKTAKNFINATRTSSDIGRWCRFPRRTK